MTAEVALLNREAVALAADSAVTIRSERGLKILQSANKIFTLSKYHPVGVMIYGNSQLMEVPWEVVIKNYRHRIGTREMDRLEDYTDDFLNHLSKEVTIFPEDDQRKYLERLVRETFSEMVREIQTEVEAVISAKGSITAAETMSLVTNAVAEQHQKWQGVSLLGGLPADFSSTLRKKYGRRIGELREEVFQALPLSQTSKRRLVDIGLWRVSKFPDGTPQTGESGIVFAGFGKTEYFPMLRSYRVHGLIESQLRYLPGKSGDARTSNGAAIFPFAQSEMVYAFMEGVDPTYQTLIDKTVRDVLNGYAEHAVDISGLGPRKKQAFLNDLKKLNLQVRKEFRAVNTRIRRALFSEQVMSMVAVLPKDELAAMAESLVNLTSFRRKVSMASETVGGPIDVAVVSKGDGFIWIKRKHYFKPELNPQFFANYHRHGPDEHKAAE
jgi:hypothetical protein